MDDRPRHGPFLDAVSTAIADRAVAFINNLTLVGDYSGQRFTLRPWQESIVRKLFGTLNVNGMRQYRKCFLALPRKQGKTAWCASVLLYSLLGSGKRGQDIYSCAATRDQAALIFRYASQMVRQDPYLSKVCLVYENTKRIVVEKLSNTYTALSADAHTAHGLSPSLVLFDELHTQPNRELWDVMASGFGARAEPLTIAITTAGIDRQSVCYSEWDYARKVRDGVIDDPTYLPVIFAADQEDAAQWDQEEVWHKAMPALGDYCSLDFIRSEARKAKEMPTELNKFLRLYLNIWTQASSRWLPRDKWDACKVDYTGAELDGATCYAGLDLASTTDTASLVLVFPRDDNKYRVLPFFWVPQENAALRERRDHVPYIAWARRGYLRETPGNVIDYDWIRDDVNTLYERYRIAKLYCDPWNATQLCAQLQADGLPVEYMRQGFASMSAPCKYLETLVLSGRLEQNGNPVLAWQADNCVVETDAAGNLKPSKSRSRERIDAIVSLVMAVAAASIASNAAHSPYEERGIVWV